MRLERLDVARMPGLDGRLALEDCAPGLNLVWGPNEAGKTSLCRAVRALLWPDEAFRGEVEGLWSDGARRWAAQRETALAPRWTSADGAEPPLVPDARFRHCFTIGMDELLGGSSATDEEIRGEVRRELAAGYDLAAIARDGGGAQASARVVTERRKALDAARRERHRLQGEQRRLREREERSEELERDWRAAVDARDELGRFAQARELRGLRARLAEAEERARVEFPAGMERLDGKELERLAEIDGRLREAQGAASEAEAGIGRCVANAEQTGLAEDEGAPQDLATLDRRLRALEDDGRDAGEARKALARALAALEQAGAPEATPAPERLAELERAVRERARAAERVDALEARLAALPEAAPDGPDGDALRDGRRALLAWLGDAEASADEGAAGRRGSWATLLLLAAAAALVLLGPQLAALAPLGLAAAWELWRALGRRGAARGSERGRRRTDYLALGLGAPEAWEPEPVRARLEELDRALVERLAAERAAMERAAFEGELDRAASKRAEVEERAGAAFAAAGLRGGDDALATGDLLARLRTGAEARARAAEARGHLDELERGLGERRDGCLEVLERRGVPPTGADVAALRAARDVLERRLEDLRAARTERASLEGKLADARRLEKGARDARDRLLAAAGLPPEGEQELRRRLERLDGWRALAELRRELRTQVELRARELRGRERLLELSDAELAALQADRERRAALLEQLAAERAELKLELQSAREGHDLEAALAAEQDALDALAEQREQVLRSEALELLLESVDVEHRERSRPDLLRRASELFSRFTRERYELRPAPSLTSGDEGFRIATREGGARTLEELSSGTRAQLLLALRLAVAERAERGAAAVPLFVDEALTNSDPERFHQIALSLSELARDGRQVFLLTSDDADLARVRRAAEEAGIEVPRGYDLAELRGAALAPDGSLFELTSLREIRPPAGRSAGEYASELDVPTPDPFAGVDALHPLYLYLHVWESEAHDLYELLRLRGADTVGRARALLAREGTQLPEAVRRRFTGRVRVVRAFLDAWRVGRARALSAEDLRESPLGRSTKLEELIDISAELDGVASQLLLVLEERRDPRLKGFHTARFLDDLRDHLRERELWSPEQPLDEAECTERTLEACASPVASGAVEREEVHQLCHALWQVFEGSEEGART